MPDFASIVKQGSGSNYRDQLGQHIKYKAFPLYFRPPTSTKGNCWYDDAADQVKVLVKMVSQQPWYDEEIVSWSFCRKIKC